MTETAGIELDLGATIHGAVSLGMSEALARDAERERRAGLELNAKIMPLNIDLMPIPAGGLLDQPRLLGPPAGWTWQIDAIMAQGYSAGSVAVWLNPGTYAGQTPVAGITLFTFPAAGQLYQRHLRYMRYGERLVFVASGLTGNAAVSVSGLAFTDDIQGTVLL